MDRNALMTFRALKGNNIIACVQPPPSLWKNWQTTKNMVPFLTSQVNIQSYLPSNDVIQLTLTLKMTTAQVAKTAVTVDNSPLQGYTHLDDDTSPTYDIHY